MYENVCLPSYCIVLLLPSCILPQSPLSLTSVHSVLPKLNGVCHPVGRDHHSGALSCDGIAAAILGSGRPVISLSGARSTSGLNFNVGLPRGLRPGDTPCCCCYCYYYNIITKDVFPRDHCLLFILSIDVMTMLLLFLFLLNKKPWKKTIYIYRK